MRVVRAGSYRTLITRSASAAAQGQTLAQVGKTEQSKQKELWYAERSGLGGQNILPPEELQVILWNRFFADTTQWWDNRWDKPTPRHPDFRHKESKVPLWLNNRYKPVWVDSRLATLKAGSETTSEAGFSLPQGPVPSAASVGLEDRMCWKLCEEGSISDAVDGLTLLVQRGCHVHSNLFYRVLKRCIRNKDLTLGRRLHALIIRSGYEGDAFLSTHLIGLYASQGRLNEAAAVFAKVSTPDAYNWAAIIFAYARHGGVAQAAEAIRLYQKMSTSSTVKPDDCVYASVLKACAVAKDFDAGKEVHSHILAGSGNLERVVQARLVNMYAKCGCLEDARKVFDKFPNRTVVTWTAMIAGYAQQGMGQEALTLYSSMQQEGVAPNSVTYVCLLQACASLSGLNEGRQLHAQIEERKLQVDAVLGGSLVSMYAKCGSLVDARRLFDKLSEKNIVAWTAMVSGYVQQGLAHEALTLYSSMEQEGLTADSITYVCLLQACSCVGVAALHQGQLLHAQIVQRGLEETAVVGGSLVNMYAKCGSLKDARKLFQKLPARNIVAWTAMITAYAHQGMAQEALRLYSNMQQEGLTPDSVTFACLLQTCASVGLSALYEGQKLHAQIRERGLEADAVIGSSLVNMYAKCGRLEDARSLFDKLLNRNVVAWTAMIAGYAQQGMGREALSLHNSMKQEGLLIDSVTYVCLLHACASIGAGALHEGKQLHVQIGRRGLEEDALLIGSLVNMYTKCGSLGDARRLFDKLPYRNIVAWTAMIAGYVQEGMGQEALDLYSRMQQEGVAPSPVTYVCLLQACGTVGRNALHEGKQLHAQIQEQGLEEDVVLGGSLVDMYAKCGSLVDAGRLFEKLPEKSLFAWTAMISGYVHEGMGQEALQVYSCMQQEGIMPDSVTYSCLLQACASVGGGALHAGKQLHVQIEDGRLKEDAILGGALVNMYAKCGSLDDARRVFNKLSNKNVLAWNAMIAGYAQEGMGQEALDLYRSMKEDSLTPNSVTDVYVLQACASVGVGALHEGQQLHAQIAERGLEKDAVLGSSLVNMYVKCGSLEHARKVFDKLPDKNIVAWTSMIAGYAQQGMCPEALSLYNCMQLEKLFPDSVTYVCLVQACATAGIGAFEDGKRLHARIKEQGLEEDVALGGSLVNFYAKCGALDIARSLFDKLPERNVLAWTAMIAGYSQQGMGHEALGLYSSMQKEGLSPNSVTYVCLLQACASVAALPLGKHFHAKIEEAGMQADGNVGAALVNMYAKCGSLSDSQLVFDSLPGRSIETWNALMSGYARQGDSQVVTDLLTRMRVEGIHPNGITLVSVLTVCSHVGLVDKGREYFELMRTEYGISATMEHYICLVDLLGRAGHLNEALEIAQTMPFSANDIVWHTILGACRKWKNVEIGKQAFEGAVNLDKMDAAAYVLMSNIYASVKMWDAAREMKARRLELGAWKKQGQSWWADMTGVVHTFHVGDKRHSESEGIYRRLEQLIPKMKKEGYVPHLESALVDIPDENKEAELCGHSEKLAIAYALSKTAEGTTIRIVKNLRVCEDCHAAIGYMSKVEKRTIICRDNSRFHVYKDGMCSCGNYW